MFTPGSGLPTPIARRTCAVPVRVVADAPGADALDASLALAHMQLAAQLTIEANLDAQMTGIVGLTGALLAADIAAKDLLGGAWWAPLLTIGLAAVFCLAPTFGARFSSSRTTKLGPDLFAFYSTYSVRPLKRAREQLLADLAAAFTSNAVRLHAKQRALRIALVILAAGLLVSVIAVGLDHPSIIGAIP